MIKLTDKSKMPFGKHKDQAMEDVPAYYFHWLWNNGLKDRKDSNVRQYIIDNFEALQKEDPDKIWDEAVEG